MRKSTLHQLIQKTVSTRFSRYMIVGISSWLVDITTFIIFHSILGVIGAQTLARTSGAVAAFTGHKLFVYNNKNLTPDALAKQIFGYVVLWIFSYLISILCLVLFTDVFGLDPIPAKMATEIILVSLNYITMKKLIFTS